MTDFIKDFWQSYMGLFTQWPTRLETDDTPGYIQDAEALAHDWEQIGSYMNNAVIQWDTQRGEHSRKP